MLRACNVRVELGRSTVLNDMSIAIVPGEVVAVIGPNGAGKSTLLGVLSGAVTPCAGGASLEDRPLTEWTPRFLARRRAVMPQQHRIAFAFSVLEVALLGRSPHTGASSREKDLAIVQASLAETGVDHLAERAHTSLSGGEHQRVQLARVLAQIDFPAAVEKGVGRYLLLDEPTSSLDLAHQHKILATARRAAERGIGVLAILHDLNLAAMYADRLVALRNGCVRAFGTPEEVLTEGTIHEIFDLSVRVISHPSRNCPHVIAA